MITAKWQLGAIGVAGALVLSIALASARKVRHHHHHTIDRSYGYAPSYPGSYGHFIDDGVGYNGSGTFSDGREVPGTNWNPNQN